MNRKTRWSIGVAAVAVLLGGLWVMKHHVVRTPGGTIVMEKRFVTLRDSLVDARPWTSADYREHAALRQALIRAGYADVILDAQRREVKQSAERLAGEMEIRFEEFKIACMQKMVEWMDDARAACESK